MDKKQNRGLVALNPQKLWHALVRRGLTKAELGRRAGLTRPTINRAFKGEGIYTNTAERIATKLGCDDPTELLEDVVEQPSESNHEWIAEKWGKWKSASNALQFRICRMRHRFIEERPGRGKCYDLLNSGTSARENINEQLLRHATACSRISPHRHIAETFATYPGSDGEYWWVVDRWIEGKTLSDRLGAGPIPKPDAQRVSIQLALGLDILHQADIVVRELAPKRVLVADDDGRAVITDFELAKLLDMTATVSTEWDVDPYRAPEVECGSATVQADIYSWARITLHLFAGGLPIQGQEDSELQSLPVPKSAWAILRQCLEAKRSQRPDNMHQVLKVLRRAWPDAYKDCDRA